MTEDLETQQSGEQDDPAGEAPGTGDSFNQSQVNRIVSDRLARQKAQIDRQHAQQSDELATLKQSVGESQALLDRYQAAFEKILGERRKALPEFVSALLDKLDPLDQLDWLQQNGEALSTDNRPKGIPPTPRADAGKSDSLTPKRSNPLYRGL